MQNSIKNIKINVIKFLSTLVVVVSLLFSENLNLNTFANTITIDYSGKIDPIDIDVYVVDNDCTDISNACINDVAYYLNFSTLFSIKNKKVVSKGAKIPEITSSQLQLIINVSTIGNKAKLDLILRNKYGRQFVNVSIADGNFKKLYANACDYIYKSLTGEPTGIFNTNFVFVGCSADIPLNLCKVHLSLSRFKVLSSMYSFTPSSSNGKIAYVILNKKKEYVLVVRENKNTKQYKFNGSIMSPVFSPNNKDILVLNVFENSKAYIYSFNVKTGEKQKLTDGSSSDLSPYFTYDGRYIVFSSNRFLKNKYELFKMNIADGSVEKILRDTDPTASYHLPVPSPRNRLLACIKTYSGKSPTISVIDMKSGEEKEIWHSDKRMFRNIDSISWSPNGEIYIVFCGEDFSGNYGMYVVNLLTKEIRKIKLPCQALTVFWTKAK
jgi:hypothetical protein